MRLLDIKPAAAMAIVVLLTSASTGAIASTAVARQGSVIYLVRHAEKVEDAADPSDPPLSAAGETRAAELARVLADAGLTSIHSTDLDRTRSTAAPIAAATGLEIELYNPSDRAAMSALLERLAADGGRHLIVGHSNTTPQVVQALGGDPLSPIDESEYDRLYVVSIAGGEVVSTLLRYGER